MIFGSVRNSRSHSVRSFVCLCLSGSNLSCAISIFIFPAQFSLRHLPDLSLSSLSLLRWTDKALNNFFVLYDYKNIFKKLFISPCSGLVVSGYSKSLPNKSWKTYLTKAIDPYKNFKKMYIVDKTGEFKGI